MVRSGLRRALPAAIVSASLAACAAPSAPVIVPTDELPFPVTRSAHTAAPGPLRGITIFLLRDGRLVPVTREVQNEASPQAAVRALLDGPTERERTTGVTTDVPPSTRLLQVGVFDTVAEVDLSGEFQSPATPDAVIRRVAQIVWTLVSLPSISAVRFSVDGEPVAVVTDKGVAVERPVSAPDYGAVAPVP